MMAAGGYVIMAPNRRGLPTFGQEWNDQISGDYGGLNQKDYLQTVDVISKEPYIDENRLGAVGLQAIMTRDSNASFHIAAFMIFTVCTAQPRSISL